RNLVDLDGSLLGRCHEVDGEQFVDTSCLFLTKSAFNIVDVWYRMPASVAAIGDRIIWKAIKDSKLPCAHHRTPTVNYRTRYRAHYEHFGKTPPAGARHRHIQMTSTGQYLSATISVSSDPKVRQTDGVQPRRTRVSLCMIVRNEEGRLADCLTPVAKLVE